MILRKLGLVLGLISWTAGGLLATGSAQVKQDKANQERPKQVNPQGDQRPSQEDATDRQQAEVVFSGPQIDEPLPDLSALPLLTDSIEPVAVVPAENDRLQLIVFMHQRTRPGFALLRGLTTYSKQLGGKIDSSVIFLTDDVGETRQWSLNASRAIPEGARMLVSSDGIEGPGTWGLNRNVTMTIVMGQAGKTVGNYALIQPSAADDLKTISAAIAKQLGIDPPNQRQLSNWLGQRQMQTGNQSTVDIRPLLAPVIQKNATTESVEAAAAKVIARAQNDVAFKVAVGDACRRIVNGGVLKNYGTEPAQVYLQSWAETFKNDEMNNDQADKNEDQPQTESRSNQSKDGGDKRQANEGNR